MPMQLNNAERMVTPDFGFSYVYIATDLRNVARTDSIRKHNQVQEERLIALNGPDWKKDFQQAVQTQAHLNDEIYKLTISETDYPAFINKTFYVHIEKHKRCKNKYQIYKFKSMQVAGKQGFYIYEVYRLNYKKKKLKRREIQPKPVHFSYPENGVE